MSQFNPQEVGMNPYGLTPLTPEEMKQAYADVDLKHRLRQAMQQRKATVQPPTAGAYPGKAPIVDPNLS